METGKDLMTLW